MFRKLISSRLIIHPGDTQEKFTFLARLRKYPVLLACLSSGILYRSYVALPQHSIYRIQGKVDSSTVHTTTNELVFYSEGRNDTGGLSSNSRAERLVSLKQAIEDDLPEFFNQSFFAFPSTLVDPTTVICIENKNGGMYKLNGSWIPICASATRAYYCARSFIRRLELVTILSDPDKGQLEVSFRVVLLPSPSIRDARLPKNELMNKLEQKARWHEFRATFHVSNSGEITEIRLTRFMPPQKPMETLRNLKQLAMLNRLSPSLPTSGRLPSPSSYLYLDDRFENFVTDAFASSYTFISKSVSSQPLCCTISPSSIFDQLILDCAMYAPRLTVVPTTCLNSDVADDEDVINITTSSFTIPSPSVPDLINLPASVVMLIPSSTSVSNILLTATMPFPTSLTRGYPVQTTSGCQSTKLVEQRSSRTHASHPGRSHNGSVPGPIQKQHQHSNSQQQHNPLLPDMGVPFLPRLVRKLPDTVVMGAFCCASSSSYDSA